MSWLTLTLSLRLRSAKMTPGTRPRSGAAGSTACIPLGSRDEVAIGLDVIQQVHAEVVEPEVGDADAGLQVFQLDDLLLQAAQLLLAVGKIVGAAVEGIVVAGGGHVGDDHAALDPLLEPDVFVQRDVRPVVDELDGCVLRADAVDAAEALDDADRVPVDVVIDEVIAVLEVLAFGDAVGGDEHVDFVLHVGQQQSFFLGYRGEEREQFLEIVPCVPSVDLGLSEPTTRAVWRPCRCWSTGARCSYR